MDCKNMDAHSSQKDSAFELFVATFGKPEQGAKLLSVHAPGRSEIAGNHTDHEGGHGIAGALNVAVDGVAKANGTQSIRVKSKGYPAFEVSLEDLSIQEDEYVSTAGLVRGMAYGLKQTGRTPQGFDIALVSTIPSGGGLSSSAAIESAFGRAMEALWEGPALEPLKIARMGQYAENNYFGKACGIMDQASICLGGISFLDFYDPEDTKTAKLEYDFEKAGYGLCLVDVGCDHAQFTDEYTAVPTEMQKVAEAFGKKRLCEVSPQEFDERVGELRDKLGDRALLRAIHYWRETESVDKRWHALQTNDINGFIQLTKDSGASSAMFLQNVSTAGSYQPAMFALGLAEHILDGRGATRIHGGGFGGSIQCFVPLDMLDEFIAGMNGWFGEGACRHYRISKEGAYAQWM